jgi:ABC-2 type transport system permease protein
MTTAVAWRGWSAIPGPEIMVNALRQLLLGLPGNLAADFAALLGATAVAITAASLLLGRLAR